MAWNSLYTYLKDNQKTLFKFHKTYKEYVPKEHWEAGDFYRNFPNAQWKKITGGEFPAREKPNEFVHTMYIISKSSYALQICPTTTKHPWQKPYWFVPAGADMQVKKSDKDVYVLKRLRRPYPPKAFAGDDMLRYEGHIDARDLQEIA